MARKSKQPKQVEALTHGGASRKNIPTAEYQAVMAEDDRHPIEVAYRRRNPDLDPQLVWRDKDVEDWSDLVVPAPPLFIQEKVHPKALIDALLRQSDENKAEDDGTPDLFADFNGLPDDNARTEFYQHDANWANRMILGDSLQVMASLPNARVCRARCSASISIRPTASSSTPTSSGLRLAATCATARRSTSRESRSR